MDFQSILDNYTQCFLQHFDNEVEQDSNEVEQDAITFYSFSGRCSVQSAPAQNSNSSNNDRQEQTDLEDLEKIFDDLEEKRLLLLGNAGAGKTVLLRHLAKKKAKERQNDRRKLLPVFASIRTWNTDKNGENDREASIIDWLANQVKDIYSKSDEDRSEQQKLNKELLEQQIRGKQVLLLFDGLDELPSNVSESQDDPNAKSRDYRVEFLIKLEEFQNQYGCQPTIITCRRQEYKEIAEKYEETAKKNPGEKLHLKSVILHELSYNAIRAYLDHVLQQNFFSKDNDWKSNLKDSIWSILTKKLALRKMLRNTFLLSVFISYYIDKIQDKEVEEFPQIRNQDQLFDNFIERFHEREENKKDGVYFDLKYFKQVLGQVATVMMSDDVPDDNIIYQEIFNEVINQSDRRERLIRRARNLHLLTTTVEKGNYRFSHLLLRDYFAFQYIYNCLNKDVPRTEQSQDAGNPPTKAELAIALGKLNRPEATDLLVKLLEDPHSDKEVRYESANSLGQLNAGLDFQGYSQEFSNVTSRSLAGFNKEDIKKYFEKFVPERPIEDSDLELIFKESLGIPFVIHQMAIMWKNKCDIKEIIEPTPKLYSQTPYEEVIEAIVNRFMIHCVDKSDKRDIYILAMMRRLDHKFLQHMLDVKGVAEVNIRLEELDRRYSFLSSEKQILNEQYQIPILNDQYATFLKKDLLPSEEGSKKETVNEINRKAVNFFQNTLDLKNLRTAQQRMNDPEATEIIKDLFHHKFWLQGESAWRDLILYLVEGLHYDIDWLKGVLEVVKPFTLTREYKNLWKLFNEDSTSASTEKLKLLEKLKKFVDLTDGNPEGVGIFFLEQADTLYKLFPLKQFHEVIRKCEEAKLCIPEENISLRRELDALLSAAERICKQNEVQTPSDIADKDIETQLIGEWECRENEAVYHYYQFHRDLSCCYRKFEKTESLPLLPPNVLPFSPSIPIKNLERMEYFEGRWKFEPEEKRMVLRLIKKDIKLDPKNIFRDFFLIWVIKLFEEQEKSKLHNYELPPSSYTIELRDNICVFKENTKELRFTKI